MRKKKSHRYLLLVMIVLLVCSFTYSFVLVIQDQRKDYQQQQRNSAKHIIGNGQLMTLDKRLTPFTRVSISGDYHLFLYLCTQLKRALVTVFGFEYIKNR